MNPYLVVESGEQAGTQFGISPTRESGGIVLGRSRACSIHVPDRELSRQHCRFTFDGEHLYVEDLDSKNGTQVNGLLVEEITELQDGDRIEVGSTVIRVESPSMHASHADANTATLRAGVQEGGKEGEEEEIQGERDEIEGREFAGLRVVKRIYRGRSCAIYRARDEERGREVALKILRAEAGGSEDQTKRFLRGAKAASRLKHSNLVQVFTAGTAEGAPFLSMEYVDGGNLEELLRQRKQPMQVEQALKIARQILLGLQYLYEQRLVMRSVRPDNLLVTRRLDAKLTDYDLLKPLRPETDAEITGIDTLEPFDGPGFAAPEMIARPLVADQRSDVFGAGACLYFMLTLTAPFPDTQADERPHRSFGRALRQPRELNPGIPPGVSQIILKSMSEYLDKRYRTPKQMLAAIDQL